jgi:hypothetical protein
MKHIRNAPRHRSPRQMNHLHCRKTVKEVGIKSFPLSFKLKHFDCSERKVSGLLLAHRHRCPQQQGIIKEIHIVLIWFPHLGNWGPL